MSSTPTSTLPRVASLLEQPTLQEHSQPSQTPQAQTSPSSEPPQKKKRPRAAQACDRCRAKKYKCDESFPCFYCRKHGYDCIYQGNTPRAWERTVNSSYVESLERRVQELEAATRGSQSYSPNPAAVRSPTAANIPPQQSFHLDSQYAPLSIREEEQRKAGEPTHSLATKYGPIAGAPGYGASPSTSNVSKIRARESDAGRTRLPPVAGEQESPTGRSPESEIRDVNPYTKVCILRQGISIKLTWIRTWNTTVQTQPYLLLAIYRTRHLHHHTSHYRLLFPFCITQPSHLRSSARVLRAAASSTWPTSSTFALHIPSWKAISNLCITLILLSIGMTSLYVLRTYGLGDRRRSRSRACT